MAKTKAASNGIASAPCGDFLDRLDPELRSLIDPTGWFDDLALPIEQQRAWRGFDAEEKGANEAALRAAEAVCMDGVHKPRR